MKNKEKITPNKIFEINWGQAKTKTLATAVELNVFTYIARGRHAVKQIAQAANSSLRGMEMLLNALVGLELLTKDIWGYYYLTPSSKQFLVSGKPTYLGAMCAHSAQLAEIWKHLTESVKTGRPYRNLNGKEKAEQFYPELVKALFNSNFITAKHVAKYFKKKRKKILDILDVAAGSGVWGISFAREFKTAKLTAIDFPAVCEITRKYIEDFKITDRFSCIKGNLQVIDFGKDKYDLVILGHICHSEGRLNTQELLAKSFKALRNKGTLLIAEFLANDNKSSPLMALLFALNMLLNTIEGDVFTIKEFRQGLKRAGFNKVEIFKQTPANFALILATK